MARRVESTFRYGKNSATDARSVSANTPIQASTARTRQGTTSFKAAYEDFRPEDAARPSESEIVD